VTANGATEPVSSTVVTPEVDGIIENLQVQEGSVVSEGDVLFTLKNEELDKIYRDAQAEVESAERAVNRANKAVEDTVAAYNKAVDDYNGAQEAPSGGDPASGEAATFDEASLRAAVTSAEDAYNDAQVVLESARSKLDDAESNLDKRTVRAPVSGTIVSMSAQNGAAYGSVTGASAKSAPATSNEPLIQISDLSKMKVTVQVNEVDISSISVGQQAKATFSAIPGLELGAVVERIASVSTGSGSTDGSMGGVVTYAVDLVIPEPDAKLKPGMTATVNITTQSVPNALIVPTAAIGDGTGEAGAKSVTVVTDVDKGEMHEVPVEVIEQNTSEAAVKGDLHDGDLVLLSAGGVGSSAGAGVVV
jgi:HlyD family secretion protein